ncbi:MAG: S8 family serine peptidase, partial [bacterium]|nr:S8 family serine peptidase [bacterium]
MGLAVALLAASIPGVAAETRIEDVPPPTGSDPEEPLLPDELLPESPGLVPALDPGQVYPNLGSQLSTLAVAHDSVAARAPDPDTSDPNATATPAPPTLALGPDSTLSEPIPLMVQLDGNRDGVVAFLAQNNVSAVNVSSDYLEVNLPPALLGQLARQAGVMRVREIPPLEPLRGAVTSQGVALHVADIWQEAGFTGKGVKVGVIDYASRHNNKDGFTGLRARLGTELPKTVTGRCYRALGRPTSDLANCDSWPGADHGTLVAETLMDVAPDASLYISNPASYGDLQSAVEWMKDQGVKVIVYSVSWTYHGAPDGTSPISPSPLNTVKWAADNGILWVNSAGNGAQRTWYGSFADSDDDGYHEWQRHQGMTPDEGQSFRFATLSGLTIYMRWDDTWGGATKDLDLEFLYYPPGSTTGQVVATSADTQSGRSTDYPTERIARLILNPGTYAAFVKKKDGSAAPSWVQFSVFSNSLSRLEHFTLSHSVTSPADSASAGVLAVGAAHYANVNTLESYSSRGPTPDGRIKPDIVGVACGLTTRRTRFCGTSQAAPHVAGLAALVLQRNPSFTPQKLADYLKSNAVDRGAVGADSSWGHGFAQLPLAGLPAIDCAADLTGDGSTDGRWIAVCRSQVRRSFARYYNFSLDKQSEVTIDLKSVVDPYLYLRRGGERKGSALFADDDGGEGTNSRLHRTLPAGDYTIEATTYSSDRVGSFSLTVAGLPPARTDPEISVTAASGVTEGADASFTVTASPAPSAPLSVSLTVAQTGDFGVATGSRTVAVPTSGSVQLAVATADDSADEADGSVTVTLDSGKGYTVSGTEGAATVAVADDDLPALASTSDPCVHDLTGPGVVRGEWTAACLTPTSYSNKSAEYYNFSLVQQSRVTIDLRVEQASDPDTYLNLRRGVGERSAAVVARNDDGRRRSGVHPWSALLEVTLAAGDYTIEATTFRSGARGTFTLEVTGIPRQAGAPQTPEVSVSGGAGVTEGTAATFTVTAAPAPSAPLSVSLTLTQQGDYAAAGATGAQSVTVPTTGSARFSVATVGDDVDEADGSVTATLKAGSGYTVSGTEGAATVAVADDDDAPPPPTVPEVSVTAGGGVTEGGSASFTVTASPAPSTPLRVSLAVTQSGDFGVSTGSRTVTVPTAGSARFSVATVGDDVDEADGSVTATLKAGSGYTVSGTEGAATVAVADDDAPSPPAVPEVSVTAGGGVTEGGSASFTITADPPPTAPLSVSVTVTQQGDYGAATGTKTVTVPTSGTKTYTVATTGDNTDEAHGSVTVTLNAGSGYTVSSSRGAATVAVSD